MSKLNSINDEELLRGERDFSHLFLITFGEPEFADIQFFDSIFYHKDNSSSNEDINEMNHVQRFFEPSFIDNTEVPHYHSYIGVSSAPKCEVDLVSQILTYLSKFIGHQVIGFQQSQTSSPRPTLKRKGKLTEEAKVKMLQDQSPISLHKDVINENLVDVDIHVEDDQSMFPTSACLLPTALNSSSCDQHLYISQDRLEHIAKEYHQTFMNASYDNKVTNPSGNGNHMMLHEILLRQRIYINSGYAQNNIEAHTLYNYLNGVIELGRRYNRIEQQKNIGNRSLGLLTDLNIETIKKLELVPKKKFNTIQTLRFSDLNATIDTESNFMRKLIEETLKNEIVGISLV